MLRTFLYRTGLPAMLAAGLAPTACRQESGVKRDDWREAGAAMERLAGGPVRLAWLEEGRLMAFDSVQPDGVVTLREGPALRRPLLTPDGARVIFSEDGRLMSLTLPARVETTLGEGVPVAVRRQDGRDVVYAAAADGSRLFRFPLAEPSSREVVWSAARFDPETAAVSRDGRMMAAVFFGRDMGLAHLEEGWWQKKVTQHNALLAPDNSYVSAFVDGTRRRLRFFLPQGDPRDAFARLVDPPTTWQLETPGWPELAGEDIAALRWSNHPRLLAAAVGGPSGSRAALLQLSPDLRAAAGAVTLPPRPGPISQIDAWAAPGDSLHLEAFAQAEPVEKSPELDVHGRHALWPRTREGVSFLWENDYSNNILDGRQEPCRVRPEGFARFDQWGSMRLDGGHFEADLESARAFAAGAAAEGRFQVDLALSETVEQQGHLSVRLMALQLDDERDAFALYRVDQALVLRVLMEDESGVAREYQTTAGPFGISTNQTFHLSVAVVDGEVYWTLDGQVLEGLPKFGPAKLPWDPERVRRLVFGDPEQQGTARWRGRMDHVLCRVNSPGWQEGRDNVRNSLMNTQERTHPRPLRFIGRLKAVGPLPEPGPDAMAAVQHTYEVLEIISGPKAPAEISVIHWAFLDGRPVASRPEKLGGTYELLVVPEDRHPELESVPVHLNASEFSLPLYFDPSAPDQPPQTRDDPS